MPDTKSITDKPRNRSRRRSFHYVWRSMAAGGFAGCVVSQNIFRKGVI